MEPHVVVLPFVLTRSNDVITATRITSTTERIHGLLRIGGSQLVVQWRVSRATDHVGQVIRTDHEYEAIREITIPLSSVAAAAVRPRGWLWLRRKPELVLTASDLRAFEEITGEAGLKLDHPVTLRLPVPRSSALAALEFAAELNLVLADLSEGRLFDRASLPQPDHCLPGRRLD